VHGTLDSTLRVEWRPLSDLGLVARQWRELAGRAVEPNVFYDPAFALAAAPVFGRDAIAALVWSRSVPSTLVGFFPARVERRRYGIALPVLVGWTHPYAPLGSPLVDRELRESVIDAWLDCVARDPQLPKLILLPYLPFEGALANAFDAVCARTGRRQTFFARHARALLAPAMMRAGYLERSIDGKKRKELRRQRKRLADGGRVTFIETIEAPAVAHALDDFLALEARGWKGRAGTAARCQGEIERFMEKAVTALACEGKARISRLCVNDQAVAALVTLCSGATAWCWKIAYDESRARFSPGVQLLLDQTERLLGDSRVERADSCATPDHPMIDHIWRERLMLADRLVCPGPEGAWRHKLACALEGMRGGAIGLAKAARDVVARK
jgi:Acetyltransferase (GNAT) domain